MRNATVRMFDMVTTEPQTTILDKFMFRLWVSGGPRTESSRNVKSFVDTT